MTTVSDTSATGRDTGAVAGVDPDAHRAVMLSEGNQLHRGMLAHLRATGDIIVIDRSATIAAELAALLPAVSPAELDEPEQWAWYPWRRTLVKIPGPVNFRRLRLDRNRHKITAREQDGFRRLNIGIVGLSVGHSIAHTLALEGLCGRLRLADQDTIELANLNRIPATIFDIGINKAVVLARRIAELDPYLPTDVLTSGISQNNMAEFFDGLDLVIEECDSLDIKVAVRQEARKRRIPVFMETSDRGLFDVERFDVERQREPFHGLLGPVDPDSLIGLTTHAKAPHVMRILQTNELSARMAASMVEIGHTVSTWPQLGGDVQLGGATVAAAVRRFGRGWKLPSGRIRVDLEHALDTLGAGPAAVSPTTPAAPGIDLTEQVPCSPLDAVAHAIALAPSGGNSQPWRLTPTPDGIDVRMVRGRTSAMDVGFRGSYVGIGAATFNAQVAAARHQMRAGLTEFPQGTESDLVVSIVLTAGSDPRLADLYPSMVQRITNRNIGRRQPVAQPMITAWQREAGAAGAHLHLITEPGRIAALADVLAASDRIRFLTPLLHEQMIGELKWPGPQRTSLGIEVESLGLDESDLAKLAVAGRTDVMAQLASWNLGAALGDPTRDRVNSSSAVAVLTVDADTPTDYLRGGRAAEQFWIRAGQAGLAVQPVSPVFLYARSEADLLALSPDFHPELRTLQRRFNELTGIDDEDAIVLVVRLSHDTPPPAVRSQRLDRAPTVAAPDPD
ncbi:Rv1355c family protein [Nakamurella sp. PAMC28650]|uniref:Rv1355c family protein n=1 Tax=Nakamurella sp. PAMC28650 TaxID=2762325 RepID=UPI00164E6BAB|nr:Rv1355c family protein [Nakamurella sp. PAMC28650]QNK81084.1 Rv1355c family protein [Nakamurella sp. PAMC28650]